MGVEAPEEVDDLDDGELRVHRRRLEADPDARLEPVDALRDIDAEDDRLATVGRAKPFEDLDRRRLASTVGTEQAEDLAGHHLEVDAVHGPDVAVLFDEAADADDRICRDVGWLNMPANGDRTRRQPAACGRSCVPSVRNASGRFTVGIEPTRPVDVEDDRAVAEGGDVLGRRSSHLDVLRGSPTPGRRRSRAASLRSHFSSSTSQ